LIDFYGGRKTREPGGKPSKQGGEPTNSTHDSKSGNQTSHCYVNTLEIVYMSVLFKKYCRTLLSQTLKKNKKIEPPYNTHCIIL
jgi:hypothetical protein